MRLTWLVFGVSLASSLGVAFTHESPLQQDAAHEGNSIIADVNLPVVICTGLTSSGLNPSLRPPIRVTDAWVQECFIADASTAARFDGVMAEYEYTPQTAWQQHTAPVSSVGGVVQEGVSSVWRAA